MLISVIRQEFKTQTQIFIGQSRLTHIMNYKNEQIW